MNSKNWTYPRFKPFRKQLEVTLTKWFQKNGIETQFRSPYILKSKRNWRQNIILPEVADYIEQVRTNRKEQKQNFPLHQYIHHGLSSQAMLFNLIGPLIINDELDAIRLAFENADVIWPAGKVNAQFEIEDRNVFNEQQAQPTSIDLVIEGESKSDSIFIEAKFVEQEFGNCSLFSDGDCEAINPVDNFSLCYLHTIGRKYWELLSDYKFLEGEFKKSPICPLSIYYQFFREVLFALYNNGYFILLVDARNPVFYRDGEFGERGLLPFLKTFVTEKYRNKIKRVTIQEVFTSIRDSSPHSNWIDKFGEKYGLL